MSQCDDIFQRIQRLNKEITSLQADQAALKAQIESDGLTDGMQALRRDFDEDAITEGIEKQFRASIPNDRPVNFRQQLRYHPEEVVREYAEVSTTLLRVGKELRPQDYAFLQNKVDVESIAKELQELTGDGISGQEVLRRLTQDGDPFKGAAERTARLRWWQEAARNSYIENLDELRNALKDAPGGAVPADMKSRLFDSWKVALMAERHYDHVRNSWGKMGLAMQGRGTDSTFKAAFEEVTGKAFDPKAVDEVTTGPDLTAADMTPDSSIGRVIQAVDLARSNPTEGLKQLEIEIVDARITGTDPAKQKVGKALRDHRLRLVNLLAKDSQLFNSRTQTLNLGSNFNMALFGPYRQVYEDLMQRPVGTKFMDHALGVWEDNWAGYKAGLEAIRGAGKEAFMDVFNGKSAFFSNDLKDLGRFDQTVDEQLQELEALMNVPTTGFLSQISPERVRRQLHAGLRLWLYDKTGHAAALRPGLRLLGAVDNVGGMFFHHYAYRAELEKTARRDGAQLGLLDQKSIDDWVDQQYAEGFYGADVTENQIKAYRKQQNIPEGLVTDSEIAKEIQEKWVNENYGAPVPLNPAAQKAARFSQEMRFQAKPDPGSPGELAYQSIDLIRKKSYLGDALIPYLQSPFAGTGLDLNLLGIGPTVDLVRHITGQRKLNAQQVRRLKANYIMAGHVAMVYVGLSSQGAIVGNGPTDWKERQEWEAQLRAEGKKPNSIYGVQLIGGLPIISTLFLMEDLHWNIRHSFVSKHDQQNWMSAAVNVLAGHLSRASALGQVGQLLSVVYGDDRDRDKALQGLSYVGAGQLPAIGLVREAERNLQSQRKNLYTERSMNAAEEELFDPSFLEQAERTLKDAAYGVSGLFGMAGGKYKDTDWLGTPIRLPWGMDFATYWSHRFFPHLHPEEKVYKELNMLNLLNPPRPLMERTLEGVPMSDDLQGEYVKHYSTVKGSLHPAAVRELTGAGAATFTIKYPIRAELPSGVQAKRDKTLVSLDLGLFLGKHTKGKTFVEAARSLMNDPMYQQMQATPDMTSDPALKDLPSSVARSRPAALMMNALKSYYNQLAIAELRKSDTPDALEWQQRSRQVIDAEVLRSGQQIKAFSGVMGGAE